MLNIIFVTPIFMYIDFYVLKELEFWMDLWLHNLFAYYEKTKWPY